MRKKCVYTLETKLEAIKLKEEGVPVKKIQEILNIKSDVNANIRMYRSDHIRMYNQL